MAKTIFNIIQSDVVGGGMENIFLEYSKIINNFSSQNNLNLVCIFPQKFCHFQILKEQNIKIEFLNIRGHFDICAVIKLYFLVKKYEPKLIIAHNGRTFALLNLYQKIFKLKNCKTLAVSHGGSIKRILGFDYIISVASHIEEKIKNNNFKGVIKTIYNGYKISSFIKNNNSKNNFTFGILSRLSKEKNIVAAIEMFKKFNDEVEENSLLIIGGEGDEKTNLKNLAKEFNLEKKVKFIGWVKDQKEFFNQIDVFLQPALSEPFGMTILESFNYKTLTIACNSFGPKEIIKNDYSGYLFDSKDKNSLFETMKKSYLQKEKSAQIIQNASHDLQEKFSYEIMEKQLLQLVKESIK